MSQEERHIQQYKHNVDFIKRGINDIDTYADWAIVVYFYCGVHAIESALAKLGKHSKNHSDRRNFIELLGNKDLFQTNYQHLYQLSRMARYNCVQVSTFNLYDAQMDLEAILVVNPKLGAHI